MEVAPINDRDRWLLKQISFWGLVVPLSCLAILMLCSSIFEAGERERVAEDAMHARRGVSFISSRSSFGLIATRDLRSSLQRPLMIATAIGAVLFLAVYLGPSSIGGQWHWIRAHPVEFLGIVFMAVGGLVGTTAFVWSSISRSEIQSASKLDARDLESRTYRNRPSHYGGTMTVIVGQPSNRRGSAERRYEAVEPILTAVIYIGMGLLIAGFLMWYVALSLRKAALVVVEAESPPLVDDNQQTSNPS